MNTKQTIFHTGIQFGVRLVSAGCAFATTIFLARALGASGFGFYVTALSYIGFFYVVLDFGLNQIFLRDQVEKKLNAVSFLGLRFFMSLALCLLAYGGILVLGTLNPKFAGELTQLMYVLLLSLPAYAITLTAQALFWQKQQFFLLSLGAAIASLATLLLVWANLGLIVERGGVVAMWCVVSGFWIAAIWGLVWLKPFFSGKFWNSTFWLHLLQESWPLGATLIFNIIYFRIDLFLLTALGKGSEVGVYSLAYKFFEFALVIPTFLMNSVYPDLLKDRAIFQTPAKINHLLKLFVLTGIVVALGMWLGAPYASLVKQEYAQSVILLRLLSISIPLFFITSPLMWRYILEKKQQKLSLIYGGSLVFNIIVNFLLIPRLGAAGAAITTILSEGVVLVGLWYFQNS